MTRRSWFGEPEAVEVSCLTVEECIDGDPCKFALLSRSGESTQRYILNSTSPAVRQVWILEINKILDNQLNLNALASSAEYHKTHADVNNLNGGNNSTCPTNSMGLGICNRMRPSRIPQPVRHFSPLMVSTSTMSETDKSSASIPTSPLHKGSFWSTVQVNPASIPGSGAFPRDIDFLQCKGPRHHIEIKDSDHFSTYSSKSEQKIHTAQTNWTESSNISTMLVTHDYTAVKEDEISVYQGEVVQILASNQQNMFLVFRAATDDCPAAEGWIPSYVLGHTCSHQRHS